MEDLKELKTIFDRAKSFYKKAYVKTIEDDDRHGATTFYQLFSYNTLVCTITLIEDNFTQTARSYYTLNEFSFYSQTTGRHVKEFIKQYLINCDVKRILEKNNYNKNIIIKYHNINSYLG